MQQIFRIMLALVALALWAPGVAAQEEEESSIKWDSIPVYHAEKVIIVDDAGQPVLNEDGTEQYRVFLVDQYGCKRSPEAVKEQNKRILKAVGAIVAKVGIGAVTGLLAGGGKGKDAAIGAAAGAAVGALASAGDIEMAIKHKKSLNQQKKLIKSYQKNFTEEGEPKEAIADLSKIKNLDLDESTAVTSTTAALNAELAGQEFQDTPDDWM